MPLVKGAAEGAGGALENAFERLITEDRGGAWRAAGRTLLVEFFPHEGDSDAALAEARAGGCTDGTWHQIALAREKPRRSRRRLAR